MKKISKKVFLISTITLASLTPVVSKEVTPNSFVQAATNNNQAKGTLKIQSPEFVSLYKKNGDYYLITGKTVKIQSLCFLEMDIKMKF